MYQRQLSKSDLADATMQAGGSVNRLSHDELRQLFNLDLGEECSTRKLLDSSKAGNNVEWLALDGGGTGMPPALAAAVAAGAVTAVNRERQLQAQEQQQQDDEGGDGGDRGEGGGGAGPSTQKAAAAASLKTKAAAKPPADDVDALELEDW